MAERRSMHKTEMEASAAGDEWRKHIGWGYCPTYKVWHDKDLDVWVCLCTCWDSCD